MRRRTPRRLEVLAGRQQGPGVVGGLAFLIGKSLQGNGAFSLFKVKAEVTFPAAGAAEEVRIFFVDGLQGQGQPVKNGITLQEFKKDGT